MATLGVVLKTGDRERRDKPAHCRGMSGTQPTSINDAGAITGFYDQAGVTGFLRVPSTGTSTGQ